MFLGQFVWAWFGGFFPKLGRKKYSKIIKINSSWLFVKNSVMQEICQPPLTNHHQPIYMGLYGLYNAPQLLALLRDENI